jgi:hypothetical protein
MRIVAGLLPLAVCICAKTKGAEVKIVFLYVTLVHTTPLSDALFDMVLIE